MVANNLSRLLTLLRNQIRLAGQFKMSHRLILLALLFISLLLLVLFDATVEMKLSQAMTTREGAPTLDAPSWWQSFRTGFVRGSREIILTLSISALLWCLLVLLVGVFRRLLHNLPLGRIALKALLRREKIIAILCVFLLIFVLVPIVILLPYDVPLSADEFVIKYIWELFTSVMLVALAICAWKLLVGEESLDDMLVALDQEEVSEAKVKEMEQVLSLEKWTQRGDLTGWYELWEEVRFGDGLGAGVHSIVEQRLRRVQQEKHRAGGQPSRNGEYEKRLQSLLSPQPV